MLEDTAEVTYDKWRYKYTKYKILSIIITVL